MTLQYNTVVLFTQDYRSKAWASCNMPCYEGRPYREYTLIEKEHFISLVQNAQHGMRRYDLNNGEAVATFLEDRDDDVVNVYALNITDAIDWIHEGLRTKSLYGQKVINLLDSLLEQRGPLELVEETGTITPEEYTRVVFVDRADEGASSESMRSLWDALEEHRASCGVYPDYVLHVKDGRPLLGVKGLFLDEMYISKAAFLQHLRASQFCERQTRKSGTDYFEAFWTLRAMFNSTMVELTVRPSEARTNISTEALREFSRILGGFHISQNILGLVHSRVYLPNGEINRLYQYLERRGASLYYYIENGIVTNASQLCEAFGLHLRDGRDTTPLYGIGMQFPDILHDSQTALGDVIVVMGPSGSGKSELIRVINSDQQYVTRIVRTDRKPRFGDNHGSLSHGKKFGYYDFSQTFEKIDDFGKSYEVTYGIFEEDLFRKENILIEGNPEMLEYIKYRVAPHRLRVFELRAPSDETLRRRLLNRGTPVDEVDRRMADDKIVYNQPMN